MGTSSEDQDIIVVTSRSVLLNMRNVSDKIVENIKTHVLCSITFFFSKIVPFMRKCGKIF